METPAQFHIRPATVDDTPVLLSLIKGLAEYERLSHEVTATEDDLRRSLFGPRPSAEALIAYADAEPVGIAVFFPNYSTFLGRPGLYLEDIFVLPQWRGHGLGKLLMAHLAREAVRRGCGRLDWSVLDWNEPAIGFYRSLGAQPADAWTTYRLTGEALERLGGDSP